MSRPRFAPPRWTLRLALGAFVLLAALCRAQQAEPPNWLFDKTRPRPAPPGGLRPSEDVGEEDIFGGGGGDDHVDVDTVIVVPPPPGVARLEVSPDYHFDKSVVKVIAPKTCAGQRARFMVEPHFAGDVPNFTMTTNTPAVFENLNEEGYAIKTLDKDGQAEATIVFSFRSIDDMKARGKIKIHCQLLTETDTQWPLGAEIELDLAKNWGKLLAEYKDFPGAWGNPCIGWYNRIGGVNHTNGPWVNLSVSLREAGADFIPFVSGYKGEEQFVCQAYQRRIFKWLYEKRFSDDYATRFRMNGISFLPYGVCPYQGQMMHKFVGIFPAGLPAKSREGGLSYVEKDPIVETTVLFLDPWWEQMGPAAYTRAEQIGLCCELTARFSVGLGATFATVGWAGGAMTITVSGTVYPIARVTTLIAAIAHGASASTLGYDDAIDSLVEISQNKYRFNCGFEQSLTITKPDCPSLGETLWDGLVKMAEHAETATEHMNNPDWWYFNLVGEMPISFGLGSGRAREIQYDCESGEFSGDFPVAAWIAKTDKGAKRACWLSYRESFTLTLTPGANGNFTYRRYERANKRTVAYKNVPAKAGETFTQEIIHDKGGRAAPPPLVGPGGVTYQGTVEAAPTMPPPTTTGGGQPPADGGPAGASVEAVFDFDTTPQGWKHDGSGVWAVENGEYRMTGVKANRARLAWLDKDLADFELRAKARKLSGDKPDFAWGYGLYFRGDGGMSNYYAFAVNREGKYQIGKCVGGKLTPLVAWKRDARIATGFGASNELGVAADGPRLRFYVGGRLIHELTDDSLESGKVGLFAIDGEATGAPDVVAYDSCRVKYASKTDKTLDALFADRPIQIFPAKDVNGASAAETATDETTSEGDRLHEAGRYKEAIAAYTRDVEQIGCAECYYKRARAYVATGQLDAALRDLNKAIELQPRYGWAYRERSRVYERLGYGQMAKDDYAKAREFGAW